MTGESRHSAVSSAGNQHAAESVLDVGTMKRLGEELPDERAALFARVLLHVLAWCLLLLGLGYVIF